MPELPDVTIYVECLERRLLGQALQKTRRIHPFFLRTVEPPLSEAEGKTVRGIRRLGKRIVFQMDDELFLILHLMIAGRLQWKEPGTNPPGKIGLAVFDFPTGTLLVTEASSKRRASLHVVRGAQQLDQHQPGGLEVLEADLPAFRKALLSENHTLKRV